MKNLTEQEILEKWSHIAMRIFPPQTNITPASDGDLMIRVRWKAENDPTALSTHARGVDLCFPREMVAEYLEADAETQIKRDAMIESAISERLRGFDPYRDVSGIPDADKWLIQ